MSALEPSAAENGVLLVRRRPLVMLWQADRLLASLTLRFSQAHVEVQELDHPGDWAIKVAGRRAVLCVGAAPLRETEHLRFMHQRHRSGRVLILACGHLDAHEALVAGEMGVAMIVSTIHDALCAARALRAHFGTKGRI